MDTTAIHRLLDAWLAPLGKTCTAVSVVEIVTAVIDDEQVRCEADVGTAEDTIAEYFRSAVTPANAANAASEGEEVSEA
jgi:hypothetical protein